MTADSVFRGVEVDRAVFNHTSYSFLGFGVFLLHSLFILCEGWSGGCEPLVRSLGFPFPGESLELSSLFNRVGHSLAVSKSVTYVTSKRSSRLFLFAEVLGLLRLRGVILRCVCVRLFARLTSAEPGGS